MVAFADRENGISNNLARRLNSTLMLSLFLYVTRVNS